MKTTDKSGASTMPRRAYSYTRLSDRHQEHGDGQRRQDEYAPELCKKEGWQLDDSLVLRDVGKSAFRGANAAIGDLSRFLDAVHTGRVSAGSVLIIENLDRLSRDVVDDAFDLFRSLIRAGIWIATRTPARIYSKETSKNVMDLLEPLFSFHRAHEESETKSFRARSNWAQKRRNAVESKTPMSTTCPPWIERVGNGYRLRPERAAIVQQIVTWALDGLGSERITERLRDDPKRFQPWGKTQRRRGVEFAAQWSRSTIGEMLSDPRLYGAYQPNTFVEVERTKRPGLKRMKRVPAGEPIQGYYPAVITEEQWQRLQHIRNGRAGNSGRPGTDESNLFTSLICRAGSKSRLQAKATYVRGQVYHYLREAEPAVSPERIEYGTFEDFILEKVNDLSPADLLPAHGPVDARETRIEEINKRLEALANRQRVLEEQIANPDTEEEGAIALSSIVARVAANQAELKKELKGLQEQSRSGRADELGELKGMIQLLGDTEGAELADLRRRIKTRLRSLIACIWVVVQPICKGSRYIHVQIDLRAGGRRNGVLSQMRLTKNVMPWSLDETDLSSLSASQVFELGKAG
jgi:DNA invertase Pin-like site-specific DNA recombinase